MTDAVKEQLSACLDGELSPAEFDLLLKRLERDGGLGESIGRYALIGEALRNPKPVAASQAFAANVVAALEREPQPERSWAARVPPQLVRRLRPVAGLAVAAGVAAVAVLSVQRAGMLPEPVAGNQAPAESAAAPAQQLAESAVENDSYTVPTTTSTPAFVPAIRLTNYVVAHSEYSSPLGRRSVLTGVLAEDDADRDQVQFEDAAAVDPPAAQP